MNEATEFASAGVTRVAIASAVASLALVAFLFAWRDPARRSLRLYGFLACGVALYQVLPVFPPPASSALGIGVAASLGILSFALPALGYLFLIRFEELEIGRIRIALLAAAASGAVLFLLPIPSVGPWLPAANGVLVATFTADFLVSLWRLGRKKRPEAPLLFVGTGGLILATLGEAASQRGVLLLPDGAPPLLGPAFVLFSALLLVAVADEGKRLLTRATTDVLTSLPNRATFLEKSRQELERAERTGHPMAVAMLDVDRFKSINDEFGHPQGDRVLVCVARSLQQATRGIDVCGRYGGEEFALLLVETDEGEAFAAVERVRASVASVMPPRVPRQVTISAGLALHHGRFERATLEELIRRADKALYESKGAGRDRTTISRTGPGHPRTAAEVRYR